MRKSRLEAFSDGVLAIIITIMVLELRVPADANLAALAAVAPKILGYLLSFVFIAIYWNNHHHMLQAVERVNGAALWANMHLLFWLSLIPLVTSWMGQRFEALPVAAYGVVLLAAAIAYFTLSRVLLAAHGPDSLLARAVGRDAKGIVSVLIYVAAVGLAFVRPAFACALYVVVALMWLIPDRRIERLLARDGDRHSG
ncbi:MAG TPA: TMEM175 family protein [Gemmatimonadales bacterium]|nr:TMEM175 family protein [Gemmatimonadales bacterium]